MTEELEALTAKDLENMTYKDLVRVLIHRIESLDDRERLLQKELARIHGLLEGRKEAWAKWKWQIATVISVVGLILGIAVAIFK